MLVSNFSPYSLSSAIQGLMANVGGDYLYGLQSFLFFNKDGYSFLFLYHFIVQTVIGALYRHPCD